MEGGESSCSGGNVRTRVRSTILMFWGFRRNSGSFLRKKRVPLKGKALPDVPGAGLTDRFLVSEFSELSSWPPVARHMTGGRGHRHQLAVLTSQSHAARSRMQTRSVGSRSERRELTSRGSAVAHSCRLIPGQQTRVSRARRSAGLVSLTAARVYSRRRWTDIRGGGEPEEPEQDAPRPRQPGFAPVTRTSLNSVMTHHSQIGPLRCNGSVSHFHFIYRRSCCHGDAVVTQQPQVPRRS